MTDARKPSLSRRRLLGAAAALGGLAAGLGRARPAAAAKAPKSAVAYQDKPKDGQQCGACQYFIAGEPGQCELVEGDISPRGWCSLFAPK